MRKRFLLISTIIVLSAFTFAACGKKSPSSPESTNSETTTAEPKTEEEHTKATLAQMQPSASDTDTTEEEKPVATATSEESTKEQTKTTTATKKDEQAKPKSATGTYNGFADTSSVEIEMSDGSYQTFMVNDEDLVNKLNDMDEGTKITFTYGAVEGQANMEILSIE